MIDKYTQKNYTEKKYLKKEVIVMKLNKRQHRTEYCMITSVDSI